MSSTQTITGARRSRLSTADLVAAALVAAAVGVSLLWFADLALTDWSTRGVAGVVLALGYLACTTSQARMAEVYGAEGNRPAPTAYVVTASLVGAVALVSGVVALVWAAESMLVVLVVATVVLWALATGRHLSAR